MNTSIGLNKSVKRRLFLLKIHPEETFEDVIVRLIDSFKEKKEDEKMKIKFIKPLGVEITRKPLLMKNTVKEKYGLYSNEVKKVKE